MTKQDNNNNNNNKYTGSRDDDSLSKNCQTIPPGSLNMFYILVIHNDNAQVNFVSIEVCQPGGTVINFSKTARNQNQTTLLL